MGCWHRHSVGVLLTVKNDPVGCAATLGSLGRQTRVPDEIIVVDGGSIDATVRVIQQYTRALPQLRVLEAPGANIAQGRNRAARAAESEILATIDAGCLAEPTWLENLLQPFVENRRVEFVAGTYLVDPRSLLEEVIGLTTMRGQLDPVDEKTFNPSARSMALTRDLWKRSGGFPEWINFSEDTLFDHKIRRMNVVWRLAADAVVRWQPRSSLRALARQFFHYGTGRGHTQIDAASFRYNLRNVLALLVLSGLSFVSAWAAPFAAFLFLYFFIWAFHAKARRVAARTRRKAAYVLCLIVTWVVMISNLAGYLLGSVQRWRHQERYRLQMQSYLAGV